MNRSTIGIAMAAIFAIFVTTVTYASKAGVLDADHRGVADVNQLISPGALSRQLVALTVLPAGAKVNAPQSSGALPAHAIAKHRVVASISTTGGIPIGIVQDASTGRLTALTVLPAGAKVNAPQSSGARLVADCAFVMDLMITKSYIKDRNIVHGTTKTYLIRPQLEHDFPSGVAVNQRVMYS